MNGFVVFGTWKQRFPCPRSWYLYKVVVARTKPDVRVQGPNCTYCIRGSYQTWSSYELMGAFGPPDASSNTPLSKQCVSVMKACGLRYSRPTVSILTFALAALPIRSRAAFRFSRRRWLHRSNFDLDARSQQYYGPLVSCSAACKLSPPSICPGFHAQRRPFQ